MGEITDLIAVICGKYGRWMNIQGRKICFLISAVVVIYWGIRHFSMGLMIQGASCIVSLGFHLYGYYNWQKKGIGE